MVEFLRSLPQGLFWYPLVAFLVFSFGRAIWSVRWTARRSRSASDAPADQLGSVVNLVHRARTDDLAEMEVQRRCLGLLLQLHGYGGYSVDNCRSFLSGVTDRELAEALTRHLRRVDRTASGPGERDGVLSAEAGTFLRWIERDTEATG
jgi:hypothetical protein